MQSFKNILHPNKNSATIPETDSRGSSHPHPRAPTKAARTPVVKDTQPRDVAEAANNFPDNTNASYAAPKKGVQNEDVNNNFPGTNPRS